MTGESLKYTFNMIATTKVARYMIFHISSIGSSMYTTPRRKIVCDETKLDVCCMGISLGYIYVSSQVTLIVKSL